MPEVSIATREPAWVVPGGRLRLEGLSFVPAGPYGPPLVFVGDEAARVRLSSAEGIEITVPTDVEGGSQPIAIGADRQVVAHVLVARPIATAIHQVDSPAFDGLGRLYVTHSGSRGVKVPVPIFRVRADGGREPVIVELPNPTSLALGPDGAMYVSSRFEGHVYRMTADDQVDVYASDLGVATGLAFGRDGTLFVGDRSGTIFRVSRDRRVDTFASISASVAAFHLAFGPDDCLYVSAPTLASHDPVYRITPDRLVDVYYDGFGRPQGLAFDALGRLHVVEALAGASGLYRMNPGPSGPEPELLLTAPAIIGVAFDPDGGLVVASNDTVWRLDVPERPLSLRP